MCLTLQKVTAAALSESRDPLRRSCFQRRLLGLTLAVALAMSLWCCWPACSDLTPSLPPWLCPAIARCLIQIPGTSEELNKRKDPQLVPLTYILCASPKIHTLKLREWQIILSDDNFRPFFRGILVFKHTLVCILLKVT